MGVEIFRGSREVCVYWRNGRCNRSLCRFLHADPDRRSNLYIRDPKQNCDPTTKQFHKDMYNGRKKPSVFARLHGVIEGEVVKRIAKGGSRVKSLKGASGPLVVSDVRDRHAPVVKALPSSEENPVPKDVDNGPKKSSDLAGRLHGVIEDVLKKNTKSGSLVKSLKSASGPPVVTDASGVATDAPIVETLAPSEENPVDKPCASSQSDSFPRFEGEGFSHLANLEGHTEVITGIGMPSGSDKLYSGSYDGTVRVWDCHSGQSVSVVNLGDVVGSLICEGVWVFVGIPNAVKAWNTETSDLLSLDGPVGQVFSMIIALDMLFAGLQDGTIVVWKISNEKPNPFKLSESLKGHSAHVTCLATGNMKLYSGSLDCTIRIWDLQNLQCTRILNGHSEAVKSLVLCNEYLLSCSLDQTIKIWAKDGGDGGAVHTHIEEHGAIALSGIQNKPILLCSLDDNSTHFYELPSFTDRGKIFSRGEVKTILNGPFCLLFTGDGSGVLSVWKTD